MTKYNAVYTIRLHTRGGAVVGLGGSAWLDGLGHRIQKGITSGCICLNQLATLEEKSVKARRENP
jgi:hypothetical protein